jgi:hypothetical protein
VLPRLATARPRRLAVQPRRPLLPLSWPCPASSLLRLRVCRRDSCPRYSLAIKFSLLQIWIGPRRRFRQDSVMSTRCPKLSRRRPVLVLTRSHLGWRRLASMRRVGGECWPPPSMWCPLRRRPVRIQARPGRGSRWRSMVGRRIARAARLCLQGPAHSWRPSALPRQPGCWEGAFAASTKGAGGTEQASVGIPSSVAAPSARAIALSIAATLPSLLLGLTSSTPPLLAERGQRRLLSLLCLLPHPRSAQVLPRRLLPGPLLQPCLASTPSRGLRSRSS